MLATYHAVMLLMKFLILKNRTDSKTFQLI